MEALLLLLLLHPGLKKARGGRSPATTYSTCKARNFIITGNRSTVHCSENTMALLSFISYVAILFGLIFLCVLVNIRFWVRTIWERRSSISRVPGPRLAAWSRLWIARALASGRSHEIWNEVNAEFGE